MSIDIGVIIAAMVPTIVVGVIAFFASKRWEAIDKGIDAIKGELAEHNRQSMAVHNDQWKAINGTALKVAKLEGRHD